jgi:hypothetical protein
MATPSNLGSSNPLHYGGSFSPKTGRIGNKPTTGQQFKTRRRYDLIARMENAGIPLAAIATMLTISVPRLKFLMKNPDYLLVRMAVTHGIVVDFEAQAAVIREQRKEMLTALLPQSLQVIANELQRQPANLAERKHQAALAQDLMDREGTFAKVSRTEIKPVENFDFEKADGASRSIINAIRGVAPPALAGAVGAGKLGIGSTHSKEALEANAEFSNSQTLSAVDQQKALEILEEAATSGELSESLLEALPTQSKEVN